MKTKILIGTAFLVVIAVAAFVVAGGGTAPNAEQMKRMRGTDGYYADSEVLLAAKPYGEEELLMNLKDGKIVKIAFDVQYRLGKEWMEEPEMAGSAFMEKAVEIRNEIILLVSSKSSKEFHGADLVRFQEELIKIMNDVVFPDQLARVEKILFSSVMIQ